MDDRRKILEAYSKQLSEGNPLAEDFVNTKRSPLSQSIQARDLAEDSLAHQVLKNTGVPIPGKGASQLKHEDFLNRILQERYPEISPDVRLKDLGNDLGQYGQGKIDINKKLTSDPIKSVSSALHEGAHQYDDKILNFNGTDSIAKKQLVQNIPEGRLLKDIDPMQMAEIINKGHHAKIPNLRDADSYGLGALKSMLKSGTFKTVAGALPLAGTAMALSSGDANAAVDELPSEIPGIGQVYDAIRPETAGSADDDRMMKNEVNARNNYSSSPAHQARLQALKGYGK